MFKMIKKILGLILFLIPINAFALIEVDDELKLEMINNIGLSKKELKTLNSYFEIYRTLKSKKILDIKELNISKDFISNLYHCL